MTRTFRWSRRMVRLGAPALALALVAAACGGGGDDAADVDVERPEEVTEPQYGGRVVYRLEAETSGGWCLPEAQLAIAGMQVARAIYDYLAVPNENGEYVPSLAESFTPDDDYTKWTIKVREGVKFHDGSDLTAEVVKNNFDAFRGEYPARKPLLFVFVYDNIADVQVTGPLTVEVTTKKPWPAFPAYLYANARFGISAQAQLDDPDSCDRELIGTGPFMLKEWKVNDHLTVERNPNYWREGYPYLDEIEFRPMADVTQALNALQSGEITAMHTSGALEIVTLRDLAEAGDVGLYETEEYTETSYLMFNAQKPPFDDIRARRAVAYAIDRDTLNEIRAKGILTKATGPFGPGNMGYLEETGYPDFDLEKAKQLVAEYEADTGQPFRFTYVTGADPGSMENTQLLMEMLAKAGIEMEIKTGDQSQNINDAIAGNFQALGWRNHPGGDPDTQYVWWHQGSPVNFGKFDDPEINRLLEEGRQEPDPAEREAIYQAMNRRFAEQVWNAWTHWSLWAVANAPEVHGVLGPDLPDGSGPFPGLANGHAVDGMWVEP